MIDDEDYEDYFLEESEDEKPRSNVNAGQYERATPRAGETINFGGTHETASQPDDDQPGCFNTLMRRLGCGCSIAIALTLAVGATIGYFRYLTPTVEDAVMDVNVLHVEKRGTMFKTYEAEVTAPEALQDSTGSYTRPQAVSVADETLARRLQQLQSTGRPVRLRYCRYASALPWRGESKIIVTGID